MNNNKYLIKASECGITFIEILLIIMVLAVVSSFFIRFYSNKIASLGVEKTEPGILAIENSMKLYKLDNGFYPTNEQGISALMTKPNIPPIPSHWIKYLNAIPLDRWGKPYHYANPGKHNDIDVYSEESHSAP